VLTTIGIWLLVVSAVAIVLQGVVAAVWAASLVKRSRALSEGIEAQRALIEGDLARLRAAIEETKRLWRPYERILAWVRHPLVIALLESLARRRARAR
jgi:hypothetical protein